MKKWLIIAFLLVFVFLAHGLVSWDGSAPTSHWQRAPSTVGRDTRIVLRIEDEGKGLEWVEVSLEKAGSTRVLLSESYSRPWPWQGGVNWRSLAFSPSLSLGDEQLSEGEFSLRVRSSGSSQLLALESPGFRSKVFLPRPHAPCHRSAVSATLHSSRRSRVRALQTVE